MQTVGLTEIILSSGEDYYRRLLWCSLASKANQKLAYDWHVRNGHGADLLKMRYF